MNATGLTEDQVYNDPDLVKRRLEAELQVAQDEVQNHFSALDRYGSNLGSASYGDTESLKTAIERSTSLTEDERNQLLDQIAQAEANGYGVRRDIHYVGGTLAEGIIPAARGGETPTRINQTPLSRFVVTPPANPSLTGAADEWFDNAWRGARRVGLDDLTDAQKVAGAQMIQDWAEHGSITTNLDDIELESTRNALGGVTDSAQAFLHYGQIAEEEGLTYSDILNVDAESEDYGSWVAAYGGVAEFEAAKDAAEDFFEEVADGTAKVEKRWGDMTDEVLETAKQWKGTNRDIAQSMVDMNSAMLKIANNQYYRQLYLSGDRSDETVDAITEMTGKNRQMVKDGNPAVISAMEVAAASDLESVNIYADAIENGLNELPEELRFSLPSIYAEGGDLSAVADAVQAYDANLAEMIRQFAANVDEYGFEAALEMIEGADGQVLFDMVVSGLGSTGVKPSGGGGGGKSAAEKLLEEQERQ